MEQPAELDTLPENSQLTDVGETVAKNYGKYYDLVTRYKAWQDWAEKQGKANQ